MTQNYELIVKGIRNFENKVTVTLALRDKKRFDGEIFDLDISLDRVEGAALEFYEAAARRSIRQVFLDVAAGLCEGDEQSPETRPNFRGAECLDNLQRKTTGKNYWFSKRFCLRNRQPVTDRNR